MKSFALITLVFLVTANDIVVEQNKMQKLMDEMSEVKHSIILKKLLEKQLQLTKAQELIEVQSESDSINDSIQLIKVSQSTYNSSNSNYTQPNTTYNYTYSNYSQPTNTYNQSNLTNTTNAINQTNSSYPYNYTTSYPYNNGVYNYVSYDNQSDTTNSTNTNSTSITCSVGYFLSQNSTCLPCLTNCATCSSSYVCFTCNYGYQLTTTGCLSQSIYNTTNSTSETNSTVLYDNSTLINSNSTSQDYNNTQYNTSTNTQYNTSTNTQYNTSTNTQYNTTTNTTNYNQTSDNSTFYNDTYTNYTNQSRIRQKFNQSRVHLKLRNTFNRFDNNNFTQIISYYNQSNQSQNTVVLFNSSAVVQKQSLNEYYLYQNNSLVVLNQEYDPYGNIVYRSINYDFTIVVSKKQNTFNQNQNQEIYGTIVYGYGNFNATYNNQNVNSGYGYQNGGQTTFNYSNQASGQLAYNQENNFAYAQYSNQSQGYQSSSQYDSFYNDTVSRSNYSNSNNNYDNRNDYQGTANFDYDYYTKSSSYSNRDSSYQSQDDYNQVNGLGYDNYNTQTSNSYSNGQSSSSIYQGDKSKSSSNNENSNFNSSQTNTVYAQNYTLVNESSLGYNTAQSSSNQQSDWRNYSNYDYSNGYKNQQSTYIHNYTNSYNVSDTNEYKSDSHYQQQGQYGYETSNGYNNFASGQAHAVQVSNENLTTTEVNATINQYNSSNYNYGGEPQYDGSSSNKDIHVTIEDNLQQFNQLRGSKKQATGSWKEVNQKEFTNSNGKILEEARQAITTKFNPQQEGFQFDSIQSIQEQIVAGINYNIKLKYLNADQKSIIYEVVLYTIPWSNQPNQVTSCSRFDQSEI
ncbi:unnamed protein product [Paramecium sonneborni]|uniref:Uncharacterized protein n=1 Tax=Paramecium sonneborni TaxID=65129 RepID=A0A8S1M8Z0_9CILI|nr:unnamed protein product [Paramecium sonneborni]